jgi:hypothetical protein
VVIDQPGGIYSAMLTRCDSGGIHPCTAAAAVAAIAPGHSVNLFGEYFKAAGTGEEEFYIDSITDNGPGPAFPQQAMLSPSMVTRDTTNMPGLWWQYITIDLSTTMLVMYDWSPVEFATAGNPCPTMTGFAMVPAGTAVGSGPACMGTVQPAAQANPYAHELLFGTDFSGVFKITSDCACASVEGDKLVTSMSALSGQTSGILMYRVQPGGSGFLYIAPISDNDVPFSYLM